MELASKYDPRAIEEKWYQFWLDKKLFHSEPDTRVPYTIVIPPPNVTGVLHMGHMLNNTIQDVLVRRARMQGKNACWVPGTDHASISTEAKVVKMLAERGIDKRSLSRDEYMKYAWEWKEKYGGIILQQLRKLGASCDWDRTSFTMDDIRYESVIRVFVDLYNKGLIYRGVRMVNWDPQALTAVSDEEVIYKESHGKLFYLRYFVEGEDKYIVVATTRPETIMGDTAVCVHPEDERYSWLKGKRVIVPGVGRVVPIIMDEYVDREFGTGALKITPAHDINDYNLGMKYNLESIDIFNDNGTLNEHGGKYAGMDRFACRKQIVKDLEEAGLIEKIEDYTNKVGQRAHRRRHRAQAQRPVVPQDGGPRQESPRSGRGRHHPLPPRQVQEHLPPLAGEHQGLVHQPPALVGPPHTGMVSGGKRPRGDRRGPQRGGGPQAGRREVRLHRRPASGR